MPVSWLFTGLPADCRALEVTVRTGELSAAESPVTATR